MVKPDVKHNYYADLDLPTTATVEDVRKAYRKLALQYHPDRNAGKEEECVPRFQAIQAANEILSDPTVKAKYDQDRRKTGTFPTFTRTAGPTGNPYQATSAYPPPPRRTQPGTYQRPQPSYSTASPTGADRFTNFPKAANVPPRNGPAADRAQQWRAWQNMPTGGSAGPRQGQAPPPPPRSPAPSTPNTSRPRPQRQDTTMPTEEQIRAGMRHGTSGASPGDSPAAEKQSAWQAFNQGNSGKQGMPRDKARPRPPTTPKRPGGFDPKNPTSDERPAPQSTGHYGHRHRSEDLGFGGFNRDPYPPPPPGPPPSGPTSPVSPATQRPFANPLRPNKSRTADDDVPYAEGNRTSTPYSSFIGEKTQFSSEGLRRSASTRDTTRLRPEDAAQTSRARSQSPAQRQMRGNGRKSTLPGMYDDSSDHSTDGSSDTSSDGPDLTQTPEEVDGSSHGRRPSTAPNNTNPFQPPPIRKIKKPTAPSSRLNGSNASANANAPSSDSSKSRAQSDGDQPSMQQRASSTNMYADPSSNFPNTSFHFSRQKWVADSFGGSGERGMKHKTQIPAWAIPSSIIPATPPQELNRGLHTSTECAEVSSEEMQGFRKDPLWHRAPSDVRKAFCVFRARFKNMCQTVEELKPFNIELFLRMLVRHILGRPVGGHAWRRVLKDLLTQFPTLKDARSLLALADSNSASNRFNVPDVNIGSPYRSTPAKARSVEGFDTQFSPEGFSGTFQGHPDYFSATGRRASPARRNPSSRGMRAATTDGTPTSTPGDMGPPPRPDGLPQSPKFSAEEWKQTFKDPSWTWAPGSKPSSKPGSKTPSRQSSRLQSQTSSSDLPKEGSKDKPHVVEEDDDVVHLFSREKQQEPATAPASAEPDAMEIDTPPHAAGAAAGAEDNVPVAKAARLYSVPKSAWREEQEKQHQHQHIPSGTQDDSNESKLKTNLDDLAHVAPFAKSTDGLRNLADMSSTLPFSSGPANGIPTRSYEPEKLQMPALPRVPDVPSRWTKTSWRNYTASFGVYLAHFHKFNKTMLAHFEARQHRADALLQNGTNWLEAAGDTSDELGFGNYLKGAREDEQVRETWNLGCERHLEAVKAFDKLREHVRKLAAAGALVQA